MDWEEIILSALRNEEDLERALEKAVKIAPKEICSVLEDFPSNAGEIAEKLGMYPRVISLLYFHFLVSRGVLFYTYPLEQQRNVLSISVHASFEASSIAHELKEKRLEALYLMMAGDSLCQLRRFHEAERVYTEAVEKYRILGKENLRIYEPFIATVLSNLGNICCFTGRFSEAEKLYAEALNLYRALSEGNPEHYAPNVARTLVNFGTLFCTIQRFSEAEEAYSEALELYRALAKENPKVYTSDVALVSSNMGLFYRDTHRFSEAEKLYTEALNLYRALAKDNSELYAHNIATVLNNLGNLYSDAHKSSEAEKLYKEALELYRTLAREVPETYTYNAAGILLNLGNLYSDVRKSSEAEKVYAEALELFRTLAEESPGIYLHDIATVLNSLGNLHSDRRKFSEAEKAYSEALELYRALAKENPKVYTSGLAMVLNNLGSLYINIHELSEAEKVYTEALNLYRILAKENPEVYASDLAMVLSNLGTLYGDTQMFFEAEKYLTESLETCRIRTRENPEVNTYDLAMVLTNLGNLYNNGHKFFEAEKALIETLEIYRALEKENPEVCTHSVARTLGSIGLLYEDLQKFSEAEKAFKEALKIYRALEEENPEVYTFYVAGTLGNFGSLYWAAGEFSEAEKVLLEALGIYKLLTKRNPEAYAYDIAVALVNLGNVYNNEEKFPEAEEVYVEALRIYRYLAKENPRAYTPDVALALNNLGTSYQYMQEFSEAEKAFREALEIYEKTKLWYYTAKSTYNLFKIRHDTEILERSRRILELAILFSKQKEYRYVEKGTSEGIYLNLLDNCMSTFGVLEALRDPQILSLPWNQVLSQEELEKAQSNLESQKSLLEDMLEKQVPCQEPMEPPENSLFIYIQRLSDRFLFFTIGNRKVKRFKCNKEFFSLGTKLLYLLKFQQSTVRKAHHMTCEERFETLSKSWYELLPSELKELIQEKEYIVFSPDRYCSFLPLEVLQLDNQPLCLEKNVVRATSLHQFSGLLTKKLCFDSSLIIGNPWPACKEKKLTYSLSEEDRSKHSLSSLKNAEIEARNLVKRLPRPTLLLRHEATGERFIREISVHSLIHFSGHGSSGRTLFLSGPFRGFPPPFEPEEFSNFRKKERVDGTKRINIMEEWHPLTDLDLSNIPLVDGAVVFLNACETGKLTYAGGGYYQGLAAVFLKNGAHSVISSSVPIFDEPSEEFAVRFYEDLLSSHSVAKSLREARIWVRDRYEAQIYWMSYVHYGSPF